MTNFRSDGWVKSALGQAIAGAQIYVCSQPADVAFVPPLPQIPLFADAAGSTPLAQPVITDGFGHYDFYVPYGTYTVAVVNGGNIQQVYTDQTIGFTSSAQVVTSVFGRIGDVVAQSGDYSVAQVTGAASLNSPALTGTPTAPTATLGTNTAQLATCAFVLANVGGGAVSSVFDRTGAVTAQSGDYSVAQITGAAPSASPIFTGIPAAPTATHGTNTTQLATCAFVLANGGSGAVVLLQTVNASNSATLDLTSLSSTYDEYFIEAVNLVGSLNAFALLAQLSTNGGSTYDSTSANYMGGSHFTQMDAVNSGENSGKTGFSGAYLTDAYASAQPGVSASIRFFNDSSGSNWRQFTYNTNGPGNGGGYFTQVGGAIWKNTLQANAVRILLSTGNIVSGSVRLYGVAH